MRALVISDTHFGAWTGEDLLADAGELALLEPHLEGVDEVIFLGDLFDFLFAPVPDAVAAADGFFALLREKLQGRRFVFLAGNHDHRIVNREAEALLERGLISAESPRRIEELVRRDLWFRKLLEQRLDGVEVEIRYPTYVFGGVLLTHGHYLDYHAYRSGSLPNKMLGRALWSIAVGGPGTATPTREDYESVTTLLTEMLYTIAQLPHGTRAQRNVYAALQRAEGVIRAGAVPARAAERALGRLAGGVRSRGGPSPRAAGSISESDLDRARDRELDRRRRHPLPLPSGGGTSGYGVARSTHPSAPSRPALEAVAKVVENLGWSAGIDRVVFAHTHQPLADAVPAAGNGVRYWNTGSWIYEPDLSSREAFAAYLERAWPGTAILIDTDERAPELLKIRKHLSPLERAAAPPG